MTETRKKRRRSDEVASAFFEWQKLHRKRLLAHPAAQRNPRLFALGYILSEMFDWETYECDPGREYLAMRLGVDIRSISPLTHELQEIDFLRIKRRRNRSAVYFGMIPQEEKQTSCPDADQEGKFSRPRKGSKLPIGKGSQLPPNVVGNVVLNEVSGAPHAPSDAIETSCVSNNTGTAGKNDYKPAPSAAPDRASAASSDNRASDGDVWYILAILQERGVKDAELDKIWKVHTTRGLDMKMLTTIHRMAREGRLTEAEVERVAGGENA